MSNLNLAKKYFQEGKIDKMNQVFDFILKKEPENTEVLFMKAKALLNENKLTEAHKNINKAIELEGFNSDYYLIKGSIYVRAAKYKKAKTTLQRGLEINPNMYRGHLLMGHINYSLNKSKEAEKNFSKAAIIEPRDPEGEAQLAKILLDKGETTKALNALSRLEKQHTNNTNIQLLMAQALIEKGALGLAEIYYDKVIEKEPKNEQAKLNRSIIKSCTGRHEEAEKEIYLYNKNNKHNKEGLAAIGILLFNTKRAHESINYLKAAIQEGLCPNFWKKTLAEAYLKLGQVEQAINYYNEQTEALPRLRLAGLYELQHENQKALYSFEKVIELDEKNYEAFKGLARCLILEKKYKEAVKICKKGMKHFKNDKELTLLSINGLLHLNKQNKALMELEKIDYSKLDEVFKKIFRVLHGLILDNQNKYKGAFNVVSNKDKKEQETIKECVELTTQEMLIIKQSNKRIDDKILDPVFIMGDKSTLLPNVVKWLSENKVVIINDRMLGKQRRDIISEPTKILHFEGIDEGQIRVKRRKYKQKISAFINLDITENRIVDCVETNPITAAMIKKYFPKAKLIFLMRKKNNIWLNQQFFSKESVSVEIWSKVKKQILAMGLDVLEVDVDKLQQGNKTTTQALGKLLEKKLEKMKPEKTEYWKKTSFLKGHWKKYKNFIIA